MLALKLAWRGLRGQRSRVWVVLLCIAIGVCARVAVGSLLDETSAAVDRESRQLPGADIVIRGDRALQEQELTDLTNLLPTASRQTTIRTTVTMGVNAAGTASRLVILKGIESSWPLAGGLELSGNKAGLFAEQPGVFVGPDLLPQIQAQVGDTLTLGKLTLPILGVIEREPGLGGFQFTLGPTVLIQQDLLAQTGLTGFASRVNYLRQIEIPNPQAAQDLSEALRAQWGLENNEQRGFSSQMRAGNTISVRSANESQESIRRFINRFGDFLRLVALFTLLLGALGVASLVRGFIHQNLDDLALLQVLGAGPKRLIAVGLSQAALLGFAGAALGVILGIVVALVTVALFSGAVPLSLSWPLHPGQWLWGMGLGISVSLVAALSAVLAIRGLKPLPVLRGERSGLPSDRVIASLVGLLGLLLAGLLAVVETRSWILGPSIIGGAIVGGAIIAAVGAPFLRLLAMIGSAIPISGIRLGLRDLGRPGRRPLAALLAIGLATLFLGVMLVYRYSFSSNLSNSLAGRAPALYAIEVPAADKDRMLARLSEMDVEDVGSAPVVSARLRTINGTSAVGDGSPVSRDEERQQWFRGREQRLSWRMQLDQSEMLTSGTWMDTDTSEGEVSLAENWANNAGVDIGDVLGFEIMGVPLELTVTSIRKVDWLSLRLNFFLLGSPKSLQPAPATWLVTVPDLGEDRTRLVQAQLATEFPHISTIDVASTVRDARTMFERTGIAVRVLGAFALAAGLAVLLGMAAATGRERLHDYALLRSLGAKSSTLLSSVAIEFGIAGLVATITGAGLAAGGGWLLLNYGLGFPAALPWSQLLLLALTTSVLSALTGMIATRKARTAAPLRVLREE